MNNSITAYNVEELYAIYELGRLYFEMGYFVPAERIFVGLATVDDGLTPSRLGLGLIKLENGLLDEAISHFRDALDTKRYDLQAKIGLSIAFIALQENSRARLLISDLRKIRQTDLDRDPNLNALVKCINTRLDELERREYANHSGGDSDEDESLEEEDGIT